MAIRSSSSLELWLGRSMSFNEVSVVEPMRTLWKNLDTNCTFCSFLCFSSVRCCFSIEHLWVCAALRSCFLRLSLTLAHTRRDSFGSCDSIPRTRLRYTLRLFTSIDNLGVHFWFTNDSKSNRPFQLPVARPIRSLFLARSSANTWQELSLAVAWTAGFPMELVLLVPKKGLTLNVISHR